MNQPTEPNSSPESAVALQEKLAQAWADTLLAVDTWHLTNPREVQLRMETHLKQFGVFDPVAFAIIEPYFSDAEKFTQMNQASKTLMLIHAVNTYFASVNFWTPDPNQGLKLEHWLKIKGPLGEKLAGKLDPILISNSLVTSSKLFIDTIASKPISTTGLQDYKQLMGEIKKDMPKAAANSTKETTDIRAACTGLNLKGKVSIEKSNLGIEYLLETDRLTTEEVLALDNKYKAANTNIEAQKDAILQGKKTVDEVLTEIYSQITGTWPSSFIVNETSISGTTELNSIEPSQKEAWLKSFEGNFEGDTILYLLKHPSLKKMVMEKLKQPNSNGLFKTVLFAAIHSTNSAEVALALHILATHCEENKNPLRIEAIAKTMAKDAEDRETCFEKLWLFFSFFKDPKVQIMRLIQSELDSNPDLNFSVLKEGVHLHETGLELSPEIFDKDLLEEFYLRLFNTDSSPKAIAAEVNGIDTGALPGAESMWEEIQKRRSIGLGETQEIDMKDALPASWHVFLSPKVGTGDYSLTIRIAEQVGSKVKHVEIKGKLSPTEFRAGVVLPDDVRIKIHQIGSVAANRYFVREIEDSVQDRIDEQTADIEDEDSEEKPGEPDEPETPPSSPKNQRSTNNSLTVNLTEKDKKADKERLIRMQKRMGRSNQALRKHLDGQALSEEDFAEVMLFTAEDSMVTGKKVYALIKDPDQKSALLAEGLEGKNLWVMTTAPHSKAAGFYLHTFPNSYEIEKKEATDHSKWAYTVYKNNGFEPMGNEELQPYNSIVGIKLDVTNEIRTLMKAIAFASYGDKVIKANHIKEEEGIAVLNLGGIQSNRIFNQGVFVPFEQFAEEHRAR